MKAEILTIGDEVMRGEIVDSNKALIAQRLLGLDIECHHQVSVRDDREDMRDAFMRGVARSDFMLVSGGLGPTRDDITSEVIAETFGRPLRLDEPSLEAIRVFFARVGRDMNDTNRKQAYFPDGADVLENPVGTAPGFMVEESGCLVFCMPGVPRELALMMDAQVLPRIAAKLEASGARVTRLRARILRTFGIGESSLEAELVGIAQTNVQPNIQNEAPQHTDDRDGAPDEFAGAEIAFRTAFPDNYLRVFARGASVAEADARIAHVAKAIHERLGDLIYGADDETMASVVGRLLTERRFTLAVAESCTGGLIAELITAVPGASTWFQGGVVAYANSAKQSLLGVPEAMLVEHGAVSEPVARAMAEGVRERFGADVGVSTTGISGPAGGTDEKPVGLVHIGISWSAAIQSEAAGSGGGCHTDHFVFPLDRARHRVLTAQVGLDWVRRLLLGRELVGPTLLRRQGGGSAPGPGRSSGAKR
jgi:nicotinamide-nucleotide amidase